MEKLIVVGLNHDRTAVLCEGREEEIPLKSGGISLDEIDAALQRVQESNHLKLFLYTDHFGRQVFTLSVM